MRKFKNLVIGGIENKIFNLILVTGILITAAFIVVSVHQANELKQLVAETNARQQETITRSTTELMEAVVDSSLSRTTQMEAYIADKLFSDLTVRVKMLQEYAGKLLSHSEQVPPAAYAAPDPARNGEILPQLILAEGTDASDPALAARLGVIANMGDLMISLFGANEDTNSCFIALPEGAFLVTDDRTATKFKEDGSPVPYDPRTRPWYRQAVESGRLIFTDVEIDAFTGDIGIVCAMPVYVDGQLSAVVGSDLFLTGMREAVQASDENGGFICVINQYGHVVFSPKEEGTFGVVYGQDAPNLRESGTEGLAALIRDASSGMTDVRKLILPEGTYYVNGAPIGSIGWTLLALFSQEMAETPAAMMRQSYASNAEEAAAVYQNNIAHAQKTIQVLLLVLAVLLITGAVILGKRIVRPLNRITQRLSALREGDLEFKMEDAYRTGDEIEVLAQSFATLSHKTVEYVGQVKKVTAEKERINSELMMAKEIQSSQLPRIFPPFPNNPSFDLYASMTPAKEVGGDFYDFFLVDDDHLAMVMADVSGKGVPAALFMMIAKTLIKNRLQSGEELGSVLANVNNQLMEGNEAGMFVTAWVGVLTLSTGKGVAVNAGHEHPALRRAGGRFELVKYRHSVSMAVLEDIQFREHEFELHPGDSLFVYTDGVPEATNATEDLFGEERLEGALNRNPDATPEQVLLTVKEEIDSFMAGAEQFDDITMLCLKYNGLRKRNAG